MSAQPVEWVLVIHYGKSAHRATYGRLPGQTYTKDYIQLSRKIEFVEELENAFPALANGTLSVPIVYQWPTGSAEGKLFRRSADRPHLAWDTNNAPAAWKMSGQPTENSAETIIGNPTHSNAVDADLEHDRLISSGFGQPYLVAVKLRDDAGTLHLRVQIAEPKSQFAWADLSKTPLEVQELAAATSQRSALAWRSFSGDANSENLYFDPSKKTDPWSNENTVMPQEQALTTLSPVVIGELQSSDVDKDSLAEGLIFSTTEVSDFEQRVISGNFGVADSVATMKTRGSAQKAFADAVKNNYNWRCALTGIQTRDFLIASHIVPWSIDETIRLDPSNGICLSILVDRAFENGFLLVQDDLTVVADWDKIGNDLELQKQLGRYDGIKLTVPSAHPPKVDYLKRRRSL